MSHDVDADLVRKLAMLLEETGLGELEYATDDWRIRIAKPQTQVIAAALAATAAVQAVIAPGAEPASAPDIHPGAVKSPMVGTVFVASDPDAPPFVTVGSNVVTGQTLLIIEAMKTMNTISAPKAGTVSQILVSNGQPVEFDQVMLVIE